MAARHAGSRATAPGAVALVCAALALPAGAEAKTFKVTRTDDPPPTGCKPDDCSLREAVLRASEISGRDKVVLPDFEGGYDLTRPGAGEDVGDVGDLDVYGNTEIVGRGELGPSIDGNGHDRVFDIQAGARLTNLYILDGNVSGLGGGVSINTGASVTIEDSTIIANAAQIGGGVSTFGDGPVTLLRTTVTENDATQFAGGIRNFGGGVTEIVRSRIVANESDGVAGGLETEANIPQELPSRLEISKSEIVGNTAATDGGGLWIAGRTELNRSTVSHNTADEGAGIFVVGPTLDATNSTVAQNDAIEDGGGILSTASGKVRLNAATVAFNTADDDGLGAFDGAGIRREGGGTFRFDNSLIASNFLGAAGGEPDCSAASGTFTSGGRNLIGEDAGCGGLVGSDIRDVDPMLDPIDDYGGPTPTVRLNAGSPAINEAGPDAPERDQRGRKRGANPDIGAFER